MEILVLWASKILLSSFIPANLLLFLSDLSSIANILATQLLTPLKVSLGLTLALVASFLVQYTILSDIQPGNSNWMEGVGAILVIIANTVGPFNEWIAYKKEKKQKQKKKKDIEKNEYQRLK